MTSVEKLIEVKAYEFRQHVRAKAGLAANLDKMSEGMYQWYTDMAFNYLVSTGELVVNDEQS